MIARNFFILLAILTATIAMDATAQRTTRKNLNKRTVIVQTKEQAGVRNDTILKPDNSLVKLSGYDKPLNTSIETILTTNLSTDTIKAISFRIGYFDTSSRELHQRTVELQCDIPPGSTRMLSYASWDKQKSFYYIRSKKPKRGVATPYEVSCSVNYITICK